MKKALIGIGIIIVVIVVSVVFIASQAGGLIREAVVDYGPEALGAPVSLEKVDISLLSGEAGLTNLVIGNPEGFKSDYAMALGEVSIKLDVMSVMSDKIIIEAIVIDAPEIVFELGKGGSNISALQKNAEAAAGLGTEEDVEEAPSEVTLAIKSLDITNAKVTLAGELFGADGATIVLPFIHLENLGTDDNGVSAANVVRLTMSAVAGAVATAVSSGKARELIDNLAGGEGGSLKEKAGEVVDKLKGLFKKKD